MSKEESRLWQQIRQSKNHWIRQYLKFRCEQGASAYQVAFRQRPFKVVWILSHMRSGSSLLTHILTTNPEIAGYGETHISYRSEEDFRKLMFKIYWNSREYRNIQDLANLSLHETYLLDKLLHPNKLANPDLLTSTNIHSILLIREPHRTLNSIRDLKPHLSEEEILKHYCERLEQLVNYAERIDSPSRALVVKHDQLLNQTQLVFQSLQSFLGTQAQFSEEYQILKTTGKKHVGDHKGNIMAGQIVRTQRQLKEIVSPEAIQAAQTVYNHCCDRLTQLATLISP